MIVIDRFEGSWAVLEMDGEIFEIPRKLLPPEAQEGMCLRFEITLDDEAQREREAEIKRIFDQFF